MTIEQIIEIGREVYAELGTGHGEPVYQKAMEVGLRIAGAPYEAQKDVPVLFRGHQVGRGIADLALDDVTIELKAVSSIGAGDEAQLRNYMTGLRSRNGAIINFGQPTQVKPGEYSFKYLYL